MRFTHSLTPSGSPEVFLLRMLPDTVSRGEAGFLSRVPLEEAAGALFIGQWDGIDCYVLESAVQDAQQIPIRTVIREAEHSDFALIATARQLLFWNRRNRYCGCCGGRTERIGEDRSVTCCDCGEVYYPSISPVVMVAVEREGKLLLAHNATFRNNMYSVIAGFAEVGEDLEQTARREVMEEVGITIGDLEYVDSQAWPFPSSLIVAFRATWKAGEIECDGVEIVRADWFDPDELPEIPRGTISRKLIEASLSDLRRK